MCWGLAPLLLLSSYHSDRWRTCISWLSHSSTNFSLQRWEAKIRRKESLPQLGIELTTTRSWIWHAHNWATRVGPLKWSHVLRSITACEETKLPKLFTKQQHFGCDQIESIVDNKLNDAEMMIFLYNRVENTVGKGGNTDYQHFLLFCQFSPKPSSLGSLKVGIVW